MRLGDTPVPIPNTMVKTQAADDTALETMWESRWLPESIKNKLKSFIYIQMYLDGRGMNTSPERKDTLTRSAGKCCSDSWFYQ